MRADTKVAVFDLDGTVLRCDSFRRFIWYTARKNPNILYRGWYLLFTYLVYVLKFRNNEWLKTEFLSTIIGKASRRDIEALGEQFVNELLPFLRSAAIERIRYHHDRGHLTILATASLDFYVGPLNEHIGCDMVVCTECEWTSSGLFAGALAGGNCYGERKLTKVLRLLSVEGSSRLIAAYSDHLSDFPLLNAAERAYLVNPDHRTLRSRSRKEALTLNWD